MSLNSPFTYSGGAGAHDPDGAFSVKASGRAYTRGC